MNFLRKSKALLSLLSSTRTKSRTQFFTYPVSSSSSHQLHHFPCRRSGGSHHWYRDPRIVISVTVISGAVAVTVYFGNLETVPYTKRTHFVLLSPSFERRLGESQFNEIKSSLRSKILPSIHPDSVRVRLIAKDIIGALQRGLRHPDPRWTDIEYSHAEESSEALEMAVEAVMKKGDVEGRGWSKEDEILDDRWVHESRRDKSGAQPETRHLEGLNWEVVVVRDGNVNAFCLPGGKIVVFTGLLDHFRSDAEIATVIGHEVGHAIARHGAEGITKNFWFMLIQLIVLQFFYMPDLVNTLSTLLLRLPFSRRYGLLDLV